MAPDRIPVNNILNIYIKFMNNCKLLFLLLSLLFPNQLLASHRFATFNIRCIQSVDTSGRDWGKRGPHCAKLIKDYKLDVVGVQELTGDGVAYRNPNTGRTQLEDMRTWLPDYDFIVWDRDGSKRKEYVGIAFRKSRYTLIDEGHFFISPTPEKYSKGWDPKVRKHPRVVGWVRLRDKKSGEEFVYASTHTNNGWSLDGIYGSELVCEQLKNIAGNTPVMVVADFNTTRNEMDRKGLKAYLASFHDAALDVPTNKNYPLPANRMVDWTYNGFKPASDESSQGREIDFMFYKGMKIKERHILINEFNYKGKRYPVSDHFPIYVEADIAPEFPKTIYVNCGATQKGDGSHNNPYRSISEAVKHAELDDTIKVTSGIYHESLNPGCSLTVIGGYNAVFGEIDGLSVIDGTGLNQSPIYLPGYCSLTLCNFEIKNYNSTHPDCDGAIHFNGMNLSLDNVTVRNCKAILYGGGLSIYNGKYPEYCDCTNLNMHNCKFLENTAPCGGGIAIGLYGKLYATDCVFTNNSSTKIGGALYLYFGKPEKDKIRFTNANALIDNCVFSNNSTVDCSPIYISDEMPNVKVTINAKF